MIYRYFKQSTFSDYKWNCKLSSSYLSVWYLSYIIFHLEDKFGQNFAIQMGIPTGSDNFEIKKRKAVSLLLTAYHLVEEVFQNDLGRFLSTPIQELEKVTTFIPYSDEKKAEYGLLVFPEAYAGLKSLTNQKKIESGMSLMVDIGGGTTDVLIVDKGEPKYLTSFRFAANTIFGDGYSYDSESNGFVNEYKNQIMGLLETNNLNALKEVFSAVLGKRNTTDIIAFLFSLASNKEIKKEKIEINFSEMLANDSKGKYVVILFYVAVIYHVANLMKAKGLDKPRHITFSGNGSKVLRILSTNDTTLGNFTKLIFEEVYGDKYSIDGLDIIRPASSKESTCKGGIIMSPFKSQDYSEIKDMKTILVGSDKEMFADEQMVYGNISGTLLDNVVESVKEFIDFTFDLNKKFSFYDNFDVDRSIMNKVKELCYRDIRTYLENGISVKKNEIMQDGADENIAHWLPKLPP